MPLDFTNVNKIYHHPGQEQMQVEVILASRRAGAPNEKPLVTMRLRYPRIIHGEVMTHRVFSRNARSSRAVPVQTMLNEVRTIPFVPWHWGKNQRGMQAEEECNELVKFHSPKGMVMHSMSRESAWLAVRDKAEDVATEMMNAGYHKQIPNRLLEPFSWIDVLITANEWDNFLWLRDHKDAEPHLQDLARLVKQALEEAHVQELEPGQWHQPYITSEDLNFAIASGGEDVDAWLNKVSAARCARMSYKPFDGDASYERELERYNSLVTADRVHASPTEHQATPDETYDCPMTGHVAGWCKPHLHGNLKGWIQARKLIPNEAYRG